MLTYQDTISDDFKGYELSSLSKILGAKVIDVVGHVRKDYSDYYFMAHYIILEDGTKVDMQGEHDDVFVYGNVDVLKNVYHTDPDNINDRDEN